jgi:hypothetical protein
MVADHRLGRASRNPANKGWRIRIEKNKIMVVPIFEHGLGKDLMDRDKIFPE